MPKEKVFASGVASSVQPPFYYIPYHALCRIADRFALGVERKKDKAWNAMSKNRECLTDRGFVIEWASHAMHHAARLLAILRGEIPDDGDDHAAAIAWSGIFLCEATNAMRKQEGKE